MAFKKLNTHLLERLDELGFSDPFPFQKEVISKIKAGNNIYAIAPKDSGKTTSLIIGKQAHLHETREYRKEQSRAEAQEDQGIAPNDPVKRVNDLLHAVLLIIFRCRRSG